MKKKEWLVIADYSKETPLTYNELCEICGISSDYLCDLIEYEIIPPQVKRQEEWIFGLDELRRIQTTLRLQRDLEVNLAGAAIVLNLLKELEELRAKIEFMQKHF